MDSPELFRLSINEKKILKACAATQILASISKLTQLPRSTAEYTINKLIEDGLVLPCHIGKAGKRIAYRTTDYYLNYHSDTDTSFSKTYKGTEEILSLWRDIASMPIGTRLIALQPYRSFKELAKKVDPENVEKINAIMNEKKFIFEAIIHEDSVKPFFETYPYSHARKAALSFTQRLEDIVKIDSHFLNAKSEMFIVHSRVIFIDWHKEIAIEIKNAHIADLCRMMFAAIKEYGRRFNHGQHIERAVRPRVRPNKNMR